MGPASSRGCSRPRARSRRAPRREIAGPLLVPRDRGAPGLGRGLAGRFQRRKSPAQVNQLPISYPSVTHHFQGAGSHLQGRWWAWELRGPGLEPGRGRGWGRGKRGRILASLEVKPPVPDVENL